MTSEEKELRETYLYKCRTLLDHVLGILRDFRFSKYIDNNAQNDLAILEGEIVAVYEALFEKKRKDWEDVIEVLDDADRRAFALDLLHCQRYMITVRRCVETIDEIDGREEK